MPTAYQTFTVVVGTEACNARCPFCISKMTFPADAELPKPKVNWRNFHKACGLARQSGTTTVLLTGKGEPTLYPDQVTQFLKELTPYEFPLIEMQTNGTRLKEQGYEDHLCTWYEQGMTTIAISVVHYDPEKNRGIYLPYKKEYIDLPGTIEYLHGFGFTVRLTCIMAKDYIDSPVLLENLVGFARDCKVEQLTVTPVNKPTEDTRNSMVWKWTNDHHLRPEQLNALVDYVESNGTHIMSLSHGAKVFDFKGQNLCLNNCLSVQPDTDVLRNLIFAADGHAYLYWHLPGSILF